MKFTILFTIVVFAAVLLVPVNDAFALTEDECLALTTPIRSALAYNVVTCDTNGFDVIVYPGQLLSVHNPNGESTNGNPWLWPEAGSTGTYQYSHDGISGTVRIVDTPNVGVSLQCLGHVVCYRFTRKLCWFIV